MKFPMSNYPLPFDGRQTDRGPVMSNLAPGRKVPMAPEGLLIDTAKATRNVVSDGCDRGCDKWI